MIKKNTKIIFKGNIDKEEKMIGGIPLSKGEIIKVHKNSKQEEWIVEDKIIDCFLDEEDQIVNITYIVKKK